jgi:sulfide:quinone oxidoreductase
VRSDRKLEEPEVKFAVLTPNVTALPQLSADDIPELGKRGYRSIIGNRPEGETPDQPRWTELEAAAAASGMAAVQIPVVASKISEQDVDAFRQALEQLPKPIAVFCRTGTRSTLLWALANQGNLSVDERISIAAKEGMDLEPFRGRLKTSAPAAGGDHA